MKNFDPCALVATATVNMGIDQERVDYVIHVGLTRCIITLLQERGGNARLAGMMGLFDVFTSWSLLVCLLLTILLPPKKAPEVVQDHNFSNSMILFRSSPKENQSSHMPALSRNVRAPLTPHEMQANIVTAFNDLIDVIHFYFLPGDGCLHCRSEWFLASGRYEPFAEVMLPCCTSCFVFDGG